MSFNLSRIRREVKREQRLKDLEKWRKEWKAFFCYKCGDKLYGHEKHHFLCNKCWEKEKAEKKKKLKY